MKEAVQRYIDAVTDDRKFLFQQLQDIILKLYSNVEVVISYKIPKNKIGPGWVSLGYWKRGISLYTNGQHHIAVFKAKHPTIKTGVGSIKFKVTDEVPVTAVEQVIEHAITHSNPP